MTMIKVKAAGGCGGTIWDVKGRDQVAGVYVYYTDSKVLALQFIFHEKGKFVKSVRYGVSQMNESYGAVVFDHTSEYLTTVTGSGIPFFRTGLRSIAFITNKGSYGPFGASAADTYKFNFPIGRGLFGGFYGSTR
ncbi:hypothetical protein BC332_06835 [Capsicum chinense]|nr:hypothetical protein BC332_06835 [Capsicum chinense]